MLLIFAGCRCQFADSGGELGHMFSASPSRIRAVPGSISLPPHIQSVVETLTAESSAKNLPRYVWASHQQNNERLRRIYEYLTSTAPSTPKSFSGALKA